MTNVGNVSLIRAFGFILNRVDGVHMATDIYWLIG